MQELARAHTPDAIAALVAALSSPRERVAAAQTLLTWAWGRPAAMITPDSDAPPSIQLMHLVAARTVTAELQTAFERDPLTALPPIVDGDAVPQPTSTRANGAGKTAPLDLPDLSRPALE